MKITMRSIDSIRPYEKNPRINDAAVDAVAASITEFGWRQPIVVDADGVIIVGHTRWKAAKKLGLKKVPVHVATDLTAKQVRAYRLADNSTSDLAEWDMDLLRSEAAELVDSIDLSQFGLTAEMLAEPGGKEGLTDPDDVPEPPVEPITRPGDLWLLGEHRLLCGDSTKAEDVERLRDGEMFDLCVTSPPYNVGIEYASYQDKAAKAEYLNFLQLVARQIFNGMAPGRFVAWNIGVSPKTYYAWQIVMLEEQGFTFTRQIVWQKSGVAYPIFPSTMKMKRARHYKPNYTHEVVAFLAKPFDDAPPQVNCPLCGGYGKVILGIGCAEDHYTVQLLTKGTEAELGESMRPDKRYQNDVWKIAQSASSRDLKTHGTRSTTLTHGGKSGHMIKEHPAAFPAEVPKAIMGFLTSQREVVYEPFSGSGTTIIACEQLGRKCYAIEIEPRYVDVAVKRWENFTGKKAVLEAK